MIVRRNIIIIIIIIIIEHWYGHVPKLVETSLEGVTILWNQKVQTDRIIPNNKSDIIIRDDEKRRYMIRDAGISGGGGGRNVVTKEAENIPKYKDLTIEIQRMWKAKAKVIRVIRETTGPSPNHSENT